jgi:hypothetical protein
MCQIEWFHRKSFRSTSSPRPERSAVSANNGTRAKMQNPRLSRVAIFICSPLERSPCFSVPSGSTSFPRPETVCPPVWSAPMVDMA